MMGPGAAAAASLARPLPARGQADRIDAEYAGDRGNAQRLGVPATGAR